jgi:hypothetical protein
MAHMIVIDRPQKMNDEDTNILYNLADIGINTCDGEGFGLCNFEQAAIGIPQVVPRLGGFVDFFDDNTALLVEPKFSYYVDNSRDMVCGEALLCEYVDYVEAIETYYFNKEKRAEHGAAARKRILEDYKWQDIADKLYGVVYKVVGREPPKEVVAEEEPSEVEDLVLIEAEAEAASKASVEQLVNAVEKIDIANNKSSSRLKNKNKKKIKIKELKAKLAKLLDDDSDGE